MTNPSITLSHRPELDGDAEPTPMLTEEELERGCECGAYVDDETRWFLLRLLSEHAAFKARALAAERRVAELEREAVTDAQYVRVGELARELTTELRAQPVAIQEVE